MLIWFDTYLTMRGDGVEHSALMKAVASDQLFDYFEAAIDPVANGAFYYFRLSDDLYYGGYCFSETRPDREDQFFLCCYVAQQNVFTVPSWARDAVVYQIFPERFHPGTDTLPEKWYDPVERGSFLGGTLRGIIRKLEYLADLGINCLYMTPIFLSASNHKYDTIDYLKIDPSFGTKEDFVELVSEAHRRGIRVVLDAVFNHISSDAAQFRDVMEKGNLSEYWDWFSVRTFPCEVKDFPEYATYGYFGSMPKLITSNPATREYLLSAAEYWTREADIDGWRIDVAGEIEHDFWREFRRRIKGINPEILITGELWGDASSWLQGDQFDTVMNYPLRAAITGFLCEGKSPQSFFSTLAILRAGYIAAPWSILWNLIGSHDTPRFLTKAGGDKARLRMAVLIQMTLPGAPFIYYGDELAMEGGADPDCRRGMAWERGDYGMYGYYKALIAARKKYPVLRFGDLVRRESGDNMLVYSLDHQGESAIVVLNLADAVCSYAVSGEYTDLLSGETYREILRLEPMTASVFLRV
jgi:glycosidase